MPNLTASDVHVEKPLGEEKLVSKPGHLEKDGDSWWVVWGEQRYEHKPPDAHDKAVAQLRLLYDKEPQAKSDHSREYLEAIHNAAKQLLPEWQFNQLHSTAMPSSGGAAGRRKPEHSTIEAALLGKLSPEHVSGLDDVSLTKAWGELEKWHRLASRKGLDTADYERAAACVADELERRGTTQIDPDGHLAGVMMGKAAVPHSEAVSLIAAPADVPILSKARAAEGLIWYAVGVPGEIDTAGHRILPNEVEAACHRYMQSSRLIGMEHGLPVGLNAAGQWPEILTDKAVCVECGLTPCATTEFFGQHLPRPLPERTWFVANKYLDEKLRELLMNTPHGSSWRGPARKEPREMGLLR